MKAVTGKIAICAAVALLVSASAYGGPWTNAAGSADDFSWTNGGDMNGLFTDDGTGNGPVSQSGNDLFFNLDFNVTTGNTMQTDTMMVDVHANLGLKFSQIRFSFAGSYFAPPANSVDARAALSIDDLNSANSWGPGDPEIGPFATTPTFPKAGFAQGPWDGVVAADLEFVIPPTTDLHIDLLHELEVIGASGSINSQQGTLRIEFNLIPEPASFAMLALGGLGLLLRRR